MALSLALAMGLSLVACGDDKKDDKDTTEAEKDTTETAGDDTTAPDDGAEMINGEIKMPSADGEKIYVYSWNDELGNRIDTHFRSRYPELSDLVVYENLNVSGTTDEYPAKIAGAVDSDKYPSIFAADESLALNFMEQNYVAPLSEAGITAEMYAESAYAYTVDYGTNDAGELMAATWQATPGILCYNVAIAEEVLGTKDEAEVQAMLSDWDGFFEVAQKMKDAGYYMVSGPDEVKYPLLAQKTSPWVVDGKLNVDNGMTKDMLELSKKIYDEGYSANAAQWSSEWTANMSNGTVFCFFGTTWYMSDTVFVTEDVLYRGCTGPTGYYWGGSYFLLGKDCPNKELAGLVIYTLTCDEEAMYDLYAIDGDFPNNSIAVEKLIADGVGAIEKLDGTNPCAAFHEGAQKIDLSNSTAFDSQINNCLSTVSGMYNTGELSSVEDAIAELKAQVAGSLTAITVE